MSIQFGDERLPDRFWVKVEEDDSGCWLWNAATSVGYGRFKFAGRLGLTHRIAYEVLVGEIPAGLDLDHLCRHRACCNPKHLEPVTHRENTIRGTGFAAISASRTHCPQGHVYDAENTIRYRGARYCRACHNYRTNSSRRASRKAAA